jgi:carboxybiotin decarboxylase
MDLSSLSVLLDAIRAVTWQNIVMMAVGGVLIYLAIAKDYEPLLLLPIGFGAILTNLPLTGIFSSEEGFLRIMYNFGIKTELFPLFIFIAIGAMTDFGPLLEMPYMALLGAAGQFGIFGTLMGALAINYPLNQAAAIGIIGAIDGPTAIYVSSKIAPELLGPIAVCAYSYMSLVPIIQPPVMRLMTTKEERRVRMPYSEKKISQSVRILFPIVVTIVVSLLAPQASPLIAALMFGNLLREAGCVEALSNSAQNELSNLTTLFLGVVIGATMEGNAFLNVKTLGILVLGLIAFVLDTAGGVALGKIIYLISGKKFNPLIGAAGISAFPMSARIVQKFVNDEDFENFLLMHAMGSNAAGQLGSVVAGGVVLAVVTGMLHV